MTLQCTRTSLFINRQLMTAHFRVAFRASTNADLRHAFRLTDPTGGPIDLTTAVLHMRLARPSGETALDLTIANGRIVVADATSGQFELVVAAATLAQLPPSDYAHDLILQIGSIRHRIWSGYLTLEQGVTP